MRPYVHTVRSYVPASYLNLRGWSTTIYTLAKPPPHRRRRPKLIHGSSQRSTLAISQEVGVREGGKLIYVWSQMT